ncbi:MAG: hypothetical protein JW757_12900 [Anaerolineales bacterium]|nr:hypothetical protein [Anaerolineales bacterium]
MNLQRRFGNFFTTVGIVLIVLFFLSDYIRQVQGLYLVGGVLFSALGLMLVRRGREEPEPSGRFRLLRSLGRKDKGDEED